MTYTEEIYERVERMFTSDGAKLAWLEGFKNKTQNKFTKAGLSVADDFKSADELSVSLKRTTDLDEIEGIQNSANSLEHYGQEVSSTAQEKFSKIEREEVEKQEILIAEREALKQEAKEAQTAEELKSARKELRETAPQVLGGIKSGETRRAKAGFRALVGD